MERNEKQRKFLRRAFSAIGGLYRAVRFSLARGRVAYSNWIRRIRKLRLDYVVIPVSGPLPERSGPPRSFFQRMLPLPHRPLSMEVLHHRLQLISEADNVDGVIFVLGTLGAGIASLQSLRKAISRLQAAGKKVVVYSPILDLGHYLVASAADRIVTPRSATFSLTGISSEAIFLKDALNRIGVQAEVVQISAYKTGFDYMSKSDMSAEYREQINWILDETYAFLVRAVAEGRKMTTDQVAELIDQAPYPAAKALELGLVDDVAYEDELPFLLAKNEYAVRSEENKAAKKRPSEDDVKKARLAPWPRARRIMLRRYRRPLKRYVGVIAVEGLITPGSSRKPPINLPTPIPFLGEATAGEESVVQMLRMVEKDRQMAAVILYINSPGGVHLSSDLMWRQIRSVAAKKPVVCLFGDVAASGGYYLAAPASYIIAPELTITGSIGVFVAHVSTAELYNKLDIKRIVTSRGERALLARDIAPLDEESRQVLWDNISSAYGQFKEIVAEGRNLELVQLETIAGGRIWTGSQALKHQLIDGHGDFVDALTKAAELAGIALDDNQRLEAVNLYPRSERYLLPLAQHPIEELAQALYPDNWLNYLRHTLALMPLSIRIR